MIYSPAKAADQKWLLELTNDMLGDLNNNRPITAAELARTTDWLRERIRTHDYSPDDRVFKMTRNLSFKQAITRLT